LRALILLAAIAGAYFTLRWLLRRSGGTGSVAGLLLLGLGLVLLAAGGRLPWVLGLLGALLPLLAVLLSRQHQRGDAQQHERDSTGGQSVVETRFLRMTLHHDSGEMTGQVLAGRFAGATVDTLSLSQLRELLSDLDAEDDDSATLLRAYLDRTYGDEWHEAPHQNDPADGLTGDMTRSGAYAILGLDEGASREEIIAAHARLIQRLHPDRGGSTYLAAKINQARDLLLGS
jgi:hypothetical protein